MDSHSINDEFNQAFQQIYSKQEVEDSSEAIQEFLDSGGNTKPSKYLKTKALTNEESKEIEGEITLIQGLRYIGGRRGHGPPLSLKFILL